MFHIRFFFRDHSETLILDANETIESAIAQLIPIFHLDLPLDSYFLQIPEKIEINKETIGSIFKQSDDLIDVHLTLKEDYFFIQNFCNTVFPSLKYEALMMSGELIEILPVLHEMHKKIQVIYNCSYDFQSLIPHSVSDGKSEVVLIKSLLAWFTSNDIVKWNGDLLHCENCHMEMFFLKRALPTVTQKKRGADQCFLYNCPICQQKYRYPNYNSVETLLEEKRGTSGGICLVFGAILRSFGFDLRIVTAVQSEFYNYWLEVYIDSMKKFIHVDPTTGQMLTPLQYEKGGRINLKYVIAVGLYDCTDVTPKYTTDIERVLASREREEEYFQQMIQMRSLMWSYGLEDDVKQKYEDIYYNDLMANHQPENPPSKNELKPIFCRDKGYLFNSKF